MDTDDFQDHLDAFGQEITYQPFEGVETTINAVVDENFPNQESFNRGPNLAVAEIQVDPADVTSPHARDLYTIKNKVWQVGNDGYQDAAGALVVNLIRVIE